MFSFQGDFKRQRNINLGGRQRNDTARSNAQAVLNKAHEEREKRELERRGLIAAATIRRRWLGIQATAKWRQQMHDTLDMNAIEEPNSALDNDGSRYRRIIAGARAGNQPIDIRQWTLLTLYVLGQALKTPKDGVVRVDAELVLAAVEEAVSVDSMVDSDQWSLTSRLIKTRGLYTFIAKCLSMGSSSITERAIRIAVIPIGSKSLQGLAMSYFARWVLAIPGLPNKIGVAGVTALTKAHMDWRLLAEYIRDEMANIAFGESDIAVPLAAINIMGNLTAFVLPQLSRHGALTLLKAVDTSALKWLNGVLSVQVLGLLVRASCMDTSARENGYARNAQELLLIFIQKWGKTASSTVIDNIFQTVDIRTVGWRAILQDAQFLDSFAGDRVRVSTIKSHNLAQLYLLCEVLNRQLETIGDDELFQQGVSLPLSDIRTIARVCRNIAFALYWSQETSDELAHIRDSAATLARQL
ncbi:hypothetical protein GGH20_001304, partial [Coemansia sp. RSA 1937]